MVYVVLGMHKSGTTLISRILHSSGINMGEFDEKVSYDQGNQFERKETLLLNISLLDSHLANSIQTTQLPKEIVKERFLHEAALFIKKANATWGNWGFKDPRTCLTYPRWKEVLPEHKLIVVYRPLKEVFSHYCKNAINFFYMYRVIRVWLRYNKAIADILNNANKGEVLVINYTEFMKSDNAIERLSDFTALQCHDLRDKRMYRSKTLNSYQSFFLRLFESIMFSKSVSRKLQTLQTENV